ncbi:Chaperone protein DnaJ [Triticum urartu]|uniref:Chaperone protein DnaJ n=1 Tax=Triticum urartu TaxID=4572 RepID=M7YB26_TRIUA|nr:Chaperone protein DnaJ [Triticum urartu]
MGGEKGSQSAHKSSFLLPPEIKSGAEGFAIRGSPWPPIRPDSCASSSRSAWVEMSVEYNMDEALKARNTAESKFHARDLRGARKYAVKAQNLCPSLEGISQMASTLEVHLAAESKIDGESDWYRILSLPAFADEEDVKKQYRKLALQLHPDKNKSVGAEEAFKLISEAWSVLSDTSRKAIYDQKRSDHSVVNYEYLRMYLNHNLLCPNCHHAFMAVETGFPCNGSSSSFSWSTKQQPQNHSSTKHSYGSTSRTSSIPGTGHVGYQQDSTYDSYNSQNFQWNQYSKTAPAADTNAYSTQASEKPRRNEESYSYNYPESGNTCDPERTTSRRGRFAKRRRHSNDYTTVDYAGDNKETVVASTETNAFTDVGRVNGTSVEKMRSAVSVRRANVLREISQIDTRGLLVEKAKEAVRGKLQELSMAACSRFAEKRKSEGKVYPSDNNIKANGVLSGKLGKGLKLCSSISVDTHVPATATDEKNPEQKRVPVSIDVPDPDFHDFDKDRTERAFYSDQVWATYDSEDGMPRLYAMVQKVLSMRPFRIRMSFLNSKSNIELSPINWVASGFQKTCGDFRVGRYQITETVNIFSHKVSWTKGPRGIIRIIPQKGDTWALYRDWSPDWNELTPDDVIYKYEIVEVIDDFTEEQGLTVIPLLKVAGFKAVFHRHMDPKEVRRIPKGELFRFSHQVPSRLLTGEEGNNAPEGCHELDPAATPVDLLKVITEVNEDVAAQTAE